MCYNPLLIVESVMSISDMFVCSIGYNCRTLPTKIKGKRLREYNTWRGMLQRCTEKIWLIRPTYIGTTCSDNFKNYSYFYKWCNEQIGFNSKDENGRVWHLDKDILNKGNKLYSEDTCVFVPSEINCILTKRENGRGDNYLGVSFIKGTNKFKATCNDTGVSQHLGFFDTEEEAFQAYKLYKEIVIKQTAEKYRDRLDPRAYQAQIGRAHV